MKVLLCVLFMLNISSLIYAQETLSDTVRIQEVELRAKQELDQIHRLDANQIERSTDSNLGELLDKQSHLFVKSYGIGSLASVSLRGSGNSHTKLLWNDIAINSSLNGTSDLSLFALEFLDEVQLDYGLRSLNYSSGGIGGAIQLNNQANFNNKLSISLLGQMGSFGRRSTSAAIKLGNQKLQSVTKLLIKEADNDFEYKDLTIEGFPKHRVRNASLEQRGLMQSLYYRLKEDQLLEAQIWWFDSERNLPPLITLRDNVERQNDESLRAILGYKKYLKRGELKVKMAYLDEQISYLNERANINTRTTSSSSRNLIRYDQEVEKIQFIVQANIDLDYAESPAFAERVSQERASVFASMNYAFTEKLNTTLSLREEWIILKTDFLMPSLAIDYKVIADKWKLFALAGRNIKYPNINDLYWLPFGNEDLRAEKANSLELGTNYHTQLIKGVESTASLAVFKADIEDYIQWRPTAFGFWKPENLKSVNTQGLEATLEVEQEDARIQKRIKANYSYTQSLNQHRIHPLDESVNKQLIYIPEHKYNLSIQFAYETIEADINYQYIGRRYISSDNVEFLPDYRLVDLSLRKRISIQEKNEFLIQLCVLNLLDEEYQAIEWRPMPNRNYMIKLQYQFSK